MHYFYQMLLSTVLRLKRTCPKCRKKQIVPKEMKNQTVRCQECGADIPPPTSTKR